MIEPHLNRSRLDGAAIMTHDGAPIIGMTLRHDRVDDFWFTLCHALGHVALQLRVGRTWTGRSRRAARRRTGDSGRRTDLPTR